jgi:hypothetical protein
MSSEKYRSLSDFLRKDCIFPFPVHFWLNNALDTRKNKKKQRKTPSGFETVGRLKV